MRGPVGANSRLRLAFTWLKDRKGRALSFADIQHYQRIIKVLGETDRIMAEIELPLPGAA